MTRSQNTGQTRGGLDQVKWGGIDVLRIDSHNDANGGTISVSMSMRAPQERGNLLHARRLIRFHPRTDNNPTGTMYNLS